MELRQDDIAVVTGAASGIGYALARQLLDRGLAVVLADVEGHALERAAEQLSGPGRRLLPVVTDVADPDAVDALADAALRAFGAIHLVCNNAGVTGAGGPMWTLDPRDWRWALDVNLWGVINGVRAFVPHLLEQGRGHVLNTASLAGLMSTPFTGPYNASKHAVVTITETLAAELALRGSAVGASVACPGFVATRIWEAERNRPEELAHAGGPTDPGYEAFSKAIAPMVAAAQDPRDTAARVLAGIEADELHILTHPEMAGLVRDRLALIGTALG